MEEITSTLIISEDLISSMDTLDRMFLKMQSLGARSVEYRQHYSGKKTVHVLKVTQGSFKEKVFQAESKIELYCKLMNTYSLDLLIEQRGKQWLTFECRNTFCSTGFSYFFSIKNEPNLNKDEVTCPSCKKKDYVLNLSP